VGLEQDNIKDEFLSYIKEKDEEEPLLP